MKLEINQFIRTRSGKIAKIIDKIDNSGSIHKSNIVYKLDDNSLLALNSKKIIKSSFEITDLLQVGDIVYIEEADDYACEFFRDIYMIKNEDNLLHIIDLINKPSVKLLSVLTKEQFENNCYKIGDE